MNVNLMIKHEYFVLNGTWSDDPGKKCNHECYHGSGLVNSFIDLVLSNPTERWTRGGNRGLVAAHVNMGW